MSPRQRFNERRESAFEAMGERRDAAIERVADARDAAAERMADARETATERVADAKAVAAEQMAKVKPRLRGVSHEYAFFASLVLGGALIVLAKGFEATLAVAIYAVSLSALFGVSALYHRVDWKRPEARRWMRRLDHTMIFFLIAGTVTPFALLVLEPPLSAAMLIAVWAGAVAGTIVELVWIDVAEVGLGGGLRGSRDDRRDRLPGDPRRGGIVAGLLIAAGGSLYVTGAIIYAVGRPDPSPAVFGYHEIFHVLVIAAAAAHFAAIALFALPA